MSPSPLLRVDGIVTFWGLSEWTALDRFTKGLKSCGFGNFAPEPISPGAALKHAIAKQYQNCKIESLAGADAWEIRQVERGQEINQYPLEAIVRLAAGDNGRHKITIGPYKQEVAQSLVAHFSRFMGMVPAPAVTRSLQRILYELGGTTLRPRGSVYWLPGSQVESWNCAAKAAEVAGNSNKVYMIRHAMDADALKAIQDAIIAEVSGEALRINEEVMSGTLGERALENRKDEANALREKIQLYERILNSGLPQLSALVPFAEESAMAANMLSVVGVG